MNPVQKPSPWSKFVLSFGFIFVSGAYALWQNVSGGQSAVTVTPTTTPGQSYEEANRALQQTIAHIGASTTPELTPTPAPMPAPQRMMGGSMMRSGLYADGSYIGNPADAYYGTVQVKVVVTSSKITKVQFLQHPDSHSNSRYINGQAMPLLTQEAIRAQSANVSGVSGATFTSQAFQQSLASALALAKK